MENWLIRKATEKDIDQLTQYEILMGQKMKGKNIKPEVVRKGVENVVLTNKYGTLHLLIDKKKDVIAGFMYEVKAVSQEFYLSLAFAPPYYQGKNAVKILLDYVQNDYAVKNKLVRGKSYVYDNKLPQYTQRFLSQGWNFNGYDLYIFQVNDLAKESTQILQKELSAPFAQGYEVKQELRNVSPNLNGLTSMLTPRLYPDLNRLFITKNGELVGYAQYYVEMHFWYNSLYYYVESLYVKESLEKEVIDSIHKHFYQKGELSLEGVLYVVTDPINNKIKSYIPRGIYLGIGIDYFTKPKL